MRKAFVSCFRQFGFGAGRRRLAGILALLTAGIFPAPVFASAEPTESALARYPDVSPDGRQLVFCVGGDIWKSPLAGGTATRLTNHVGYDMMPRWSPDGRHIAFSSKREGNFDVFVMDEDGRNVRRLTWNSANDTVTGWTPDGKGVLFTSNREYATYYGSNCLYRVAVEGSNALRVLENQIEHAVMSPDGKRLAYVRNRFPWTRLHYRGPAAWEIWVADLTDGSHHPVTRFDGVDGWPLWEPDGKHLTFVSDRDGVPNLWSVRDDGTSLRQITRFPSGRIAFPGIARQTGAVAFERDGGLWVFEPGREARPVTVLLPDDEKLNLVEYRNVKKEATELAVSPDGKQVAFVVRGDVFVVKEDGGKARNLTNSPSREKSLAWAPDGRALVYVSDAAGNDDLWLVRSADPGRPELWKSLKTESVPLTATPENEAAPAFSPAGDRLAFVKAPGDLWVMKPDGAEARRLLESWNVPAFQWSPDGQWFALSMMDCEFNHDIYLLPAEGGKAVNVTRHPDEDLAPVWSPDGKALAFTAKRNTDEKLDNVDVYLLWLTQAEDEKTEAEREEEWATEKGDGAAGEKSQKTGETGGKAKPAKPEITVKVDFDEICFRARRLTTLPGTQQSERFSPDSRRLAYTSNHGGELSLWTVNLFGKDAKPASGAPLLPESSVAWNAESKKLYYLGKGGVLAAWAETAEKKIDFEGKQVIDYRSERLQKFDEAWRLMNDNFYDAGFHGCDWKAVRAVYRPLAARAAAIEDFNDVVNMMLGELNASHTGIYRRIPGENDVETGFLGALWDEGYSGPGLRVREVLKKTPAAAEKSRLLPGDVVLAVNGRPFPEGSDAAALFANTVGEKIWLRVKRGKDQAQEDVEITPVNLATVQAANYRAWADRRRDSAHQLSRDRVGYIHVQSMGQPSLEKFEMALYDEARGRDALVIDVRNNGGGWTTDYLLAMLMVREHAQTTQRGAPCQAYPQDRRPLYAFTKPIAVLCNENSYSNAEIFSWAIKTLGRGPIVGTQTHGAVISTDDATLVDGSTFRLPGRSWKVAGSGVNMELHGCVPDYPVDLAPEDEVADRDPQLEKAVRILMREK